MKSTGQKIAKSEPEGDPEVKARLLASTLEMSEGDLKVLKVQSGTWEETLSRLEQFVAEREVTRTVMMDHADWKDGFAGAYRRSALVPHPLHAERGELLETLVRTTVHFDGWKFIVGRTHVDIHRRLPASGRATSVPAQRLGVNAVSDYDFIWNGEQQECEECREPTDELFERGDLKRVCEGCLNGVDEDFAREMEEVRHAN